MTITESFKRLASKMLGKPVDQVKGQTISEVIDYTAENYDENSGGLNSIPEYGMGQIVRDGKLYKMDVRIGYTHAPTNGFYPTVHRMSNNAFTNDDRLTKIMIPKEIENIPVDTFRNCRALTDVYYDGSEAEWNNMTIDNDNEYNQFLIDATKHFNWDRNKPIPID